jgi:hypothetical protein
MHNPRKVIKSIEQHSVVVFELSWIKKVSNGMEISRMLCPL